MKSVRVHHDTVAASVPENTDLDSAQSATDEVVSGSATAISGAHKIKIGISACLLGYKVRYDGDDKRNALISGEWKRYFEFVPLCPEVESGMTVPREAIRLVRSKQGEIRALGVLNPKMDLTNALNGFGLQRMRGLGDIRGFLVKSKSPSCGLAGVPIFSEHGLVADAGSGLFTSILMEAYPLLPIEQEDRLGDPATQEHFLERIWVYDRWQKLVHSGITVAKLIDFHRVHKYLVLSHEQPVYRALGPRVARAHAGNLDLVASVYAQKLMDALKIPATRENHFNVLQHLAGYLKSQLDPREKQSLHQLLQRYKSGEAPLSAPAKLLRKHFRSLASQSTAGHAYLEWHADPLDQIAPDRAGAIGISCVG